MNPPEKALVLSVDEKSQIQALDRTQPGLPMKPARPAPYPRLQEERHHHPVRRSQRAGGQCDRRLHARHRAEEFLRFLRKIDKLTPKDLDVH